MLTIYVVEDSHLIRRTIIAKMRAVSKRLDDGSTRCTFHEHETVESVLPIIDTFKHDRNAIVTIDHNLDSTGGQLRGSHLIVALRQARFAGVIISISGDDTTTEEHLRLGANVMFGKPLPRVEKIVDCLSAVFARRDAAERASDNAGDPPAGDDATSRPGDPASPAATAAPAEGVDLVETTERWSAARTVGAALPPP